MSVSVAINGFRRIGRDTCARHRARAKRTISEVVGINDLGPVETNAPPPALSTPSTAAFPRGHGQGDTDQRRQRRHQGHRRSRIPRNCREELGVDIALECTAIFTSKEKASMHLTAGRHSACWCRAGPTAVDFTVVYGVNHDKLTKDHKVVSNASCTTNCWCRSRKVLNDASASRGFMTTIHSVHRRPATRRHHATGSLPAPRRRG